MTPGRSRNSATLAAPFTTAATARRLHFGHKDWVFLGRPSVGPLDSDFAGRDPEAHAGTGTDARGIARATPRDACHPMLAAVMDSEANREDGRPIAHTPFNALTVQAIEAGRALWTETRSDRLEATRNFGI